MQLASIERISQCCNVSYNTTERLSKDFTTAAKHKGATTPPCATLLMVPMLLLCSYSWYVLCPTYSPHRHCNNRMQRLGLAFKRVNQLAQSPPMQGCHQTMPSSFGRPSTPLLHVIVQAEASETMDHLGCIATGDALLVMYVSTALGLRHLRTRVCLSVIDHIFKWIVP